MARVIIPTNPEKVLTLADKVMAKHTSDGANSPLNALQDNNWTENGPKVEQARALNKQAKELQKEVEKLFEQRDHLLTDVTASLRASSKTLMGIHNKNPKKLGDWGYDVHDTVHTKKNAPKP